ncbi:MAG: hypothetical protein L6R39_001347 [Caloplaca ligustica]|nr:MAG: hypothetical protein L6R39_001347 [Caloplaca ligustica]
MSGVHKFVGRGGPRESVDKNGQRFNALLGGLGISAPGTASVAETMHSQTEARPLSRQAVAKLSRVSQPPFKPEGSGLDLHAAPQQPVAHVQTTLATRTTSNDRRGAREYSTVEIKSQGVFDTDTEQLDDTSGFSGPVKLEGLPIKSEAVLEVRVHSQDRSKQSDTLRAPRKLRHPSHATTSPGSERYADTEVDHDGDDEQDDPSQYTDLQMHGARDQGNFLPTSGQGATDEALLFQAGQHAHRSGQSTYPPKASLRFPDPVSHAHARHHPYDLRSLENASMYNEESESEYGNTGSQQFDDRSMVIRSMSDNPMNPPRADIANGKRKWSPEPGSQKPIWVSEGSDAPPQVAGHPVDWRSDSGKPPMATPKREQAAESLDYDLKALSNMDYRQLAEESFDSSPKPTDLGDPRLTDTSTLKEKLQHLHSLDGPTEQIQSLRQAFFSSLPIEQYEECGDVMAEQFGQIILRFKQARQKKRSIAMEFEEEVAVQKKVVERRKVAVTKDLARLKRAGQDVVQGR